MAGAELGGLSEDARRWLDTAQSQLAALLDLVRETERVRGALESATRENARLKALVREHVEVCRRLDASERLGRQLSEEVVRLRRDALAGALDVREPPPGSVGGATGLGARSFAFLGWMLLLLAVLVWALFQFTVETWWAFSRPLEEA